MLGSLPGVASVERGEDTERFQTFRLRISGNEEIGERVYDAARTEGWPLSELRRDDKTLEQVFRELTASGLEAPA